MKRSSYLKHDGVIELGKRSLMVWCYGRTGKYVCRLEINGARMAVYTGRKGGKKLANLSWERLIEKVGKR